MSWSISIKNVFFVALPLVVLAIDLQRAPYIFQTLQSNELLSVQRLLEERRVHLGRLRGHEVFVSTDEISKADFIGHLRGERNALVLTHFLTSDGNDSRMGLLGRAVRQKLRQIDSKAEEKFVQHLLGTPGRKPGDTVRVDFSDGFDPSFPIFALYIVILRETAAGQARASALREGMQRSYAQASEDKLDNIIVPALGIDESANMLPFDAFLAGSLDTLPSARYPRNVFLSWYPRWESNTLTVATRALSSRLDPTFSDGVSLSERLQNPMLRLACIALALCLFSSSLAIALNWVNFLVITSAFAASFAGLWALLGFLAASQDPDVTFAVRAVAILIFAICFRWTVSWDVKALFAGEAKDDP